MPRSLPSLLLVALLLPASASASASAGAAPESDVRHVLDVSLDPSTGMLSGTDELHMPHRRSVTFRLHEGLTAEATCGGRNVRLERGDEPGTLTARLPAACRDEAGRVTLRVQLSGVIADPVTDEPSLHFVTGDRTSGLISPEGAFLAPGTAWYPETGDIALFDARITVPKEWSVISQGDAHPPEESGDGRRTFRYSSTIPADGLALSAGPYVSSSLQHGDVTITTWFFEEEASLAPTFLEAARRDLDRLTELLGPYPGSRFDIVENFFTTGYGFPSYTLLGRDVIRMGPRALRPGYLDHEIAHVWLGNHVMVDMEGGNWCEGLTTYVTNYLNTAREGEAEALQARQRVSQRYSVDVPKEQDIAPAAFREKSDDAGASIGYGKVSMVFHLLDRMLGPEALRTGLADFVRDWGGRRASWTDIRASLERASGRDLGPFFAEWIARPGLPDLALEGVRDEDGAVAGEIVQRGHAYSLPLELVVEAVDGTTVTATVDVAGARTPFRVPVAGRVHRVQLDPSFHVPRRIAPQDLPASLARTLAAPDLLVLHGNPAGEDAPESLIAREQALAALARMAAGEHGRVLAAKDAAQAEFDASSVLLLGDVTENGWVRELAPVFDEHAGVDVSRARSFRAGDRRWREATDAVLVSTPHPAREGATVTAWVPVWDDAVDGGRMMFYYGWDTWVAMREGRARDRGTSWPARSATSVLLAEREKPATPAGRMLATVQSLVAPRLEGRSAGPRAYEAGAWLAEALASAGVEPFGEPPGFAMPFAFGVRDLPGRPLFAHGQGPGQPRRMIPVVPATEWLPGASVTEAAAASGVPTTSGRLPSVTPLPRGLVVVPDSEGAFAGLDLQGAAAVVIDSPPSGDPGRLVRLIGDARRRNAAALILLRPDAPWPGEPDLVLAASLPDPARAERWTRLEEVQGRMALHRAVTADRARLPGLPHHGDFPLFFAGSELAEALREAGGLGRGAASFAGMDADLRLSYSLETISDANVVGHIPGRAGGHQPVVVLSAHHDGLGEAADGRFLQGAADNAAGVAVVLEVARRLASRPADLPVVVAFLSGEEWGLQGSRALVGQWIGGRPDVAAVINVDSVGHAGRPVHVIGRSREPRLAAILDAAATAAGFEPGGDIDRHADRDGSDHWPWVALDVPAISLFQADYGVINTPDDTTDRLDADVLGRLADALEQAIRRVAASTVY